MLDVLRKNGIGVIIGSVILTTLDAIKPQWGKGPKKKRANEQPTNMEQFKQEQEIEKEQALKSGKNVNATKMKDLTAFQKARLTTEEIYNNIFNGANMTVNTWFNLIGASTMAAGGATSNSSVFIVAAMLVSPIMGPLLGITFGYRIADWDLIKLGFINECKMATTCFLVGFLVAVFIGTASVDTYNWPTDVMMAKGQAFSLVVSIIVSAAAGCILGIGVTSGGVNALVGTAISAGLLPPLVNAGMLIAYGSFYCEKAKKSDLVEMGVYNVLFYVTHVITIVIVANIMFALKAVDKRFKDDDVSFDDIPSLAAHRENLRKRGIDPDDKSVLGILTPHLLIEKLKDTADKAKNLKVSDITSGVMHVAEELKNKTQTAAHILSAGIIPDSEHHEVKHHWAQTAQDESEILEEHTDISSGTYNPIQGSTRPSTVPPVMIDHTADVITHTSKFKIGDRVTDGDGKNATVRYIGPIKDAKVQIESTIWIGVEWEAAGRGRNDGSCKDKFGTIHRYFSCSDGMGSFMSEPKLWPMAKRKFADETYAIEEGVATLPQEFELGQLDRQKGTGPTEDWENV